MFHSFSRSILVALVAVAAVYADDPKCNSSARECDQRIRQMLSGRRFLGVTIEEQRPNGLVVKSVTEKSPAERYGLKAGDRLIAINGRSLTQASAKDFRQIVAGARADGKLWMIIWRRGAYRRIDARLEPYTKEQIDKIIAAHLSESHTTTAGAQ
jgi:predicted metalloprotease with PDZ domain